jgi:hypothetical protein
MNRRLRFGSGADPFGESNPRSVPSVLNPMRVLDLQDAYFPPPIPPDYQPPPPPVEPAQIIEPTHGWWRQQGAFGFRYQGAIPDLAGSIIPLTEQLHLPGPPRLWWVNWFRFSRNVSDEASPNYGTWDLRGRVTYGVGGAQNVIEVDVAAGIQMAVVASSIKVDLLTYSPQVQISGGNTETPIYDPGDVGVIAGAMFGDGAAGGALPPSWSTPVYEAGALGIIELDIPVPDFARTLVLHTNSFNAADLANCFLHFTSPGVAIKSVNLQTVYSLMTTDRGIAIPVGTNQIRLSTAAPFPAGGRIGLQFFLAL